MWLAVLAGLAWGQGAIALKLTVLPHYLSLGERVAEGGGYRIASWTLLAPLALASAVSRGGSASASAKPALASIALCPLVGVMLCLAAAWALGSPRWRSYVLCGVTAVGLLGMAAALAATLQFRDAILAERTFFAMVSRVDTPHADPVTVAAARGFVARHGESRWVGEALRIVAMAEWDAGHFEESSAVWRRFSAGFRDRTLPGVAYAEYNIALCDERLGRRAAAQRHLRTAIETIRVRGDGIQGWVAADSAERLSSLERSAGRYALAGYWKTKSATFAGVYSTE